MKSYPKNKPWRSKPYRKWISEQRCIVTGCMPCVPHHVKCFGNHGMGMKNGDNECVPVLDKIHHHIHQYGEIQVFASYWDMDANAIRGRLGAICNQLFDKWSNLQKLEDT